jgi:NADH:ubiquinone oxidoreductase subunit 3 (subunit A)
MNFVGHIFMIQQHVQMDTKTSCSLPYEHGLSDGVNAQKHVIYHYYILKFLFILWTTGVHMNILKLQQHLCGLHRTKIDFQVAYRE